jgi:hypothetical protein
VSHVPAATQRREIAYLVKTYLGAKQADAISVTADQATALQYAIWHLWGFDSEMLNPDPLPAIGPIYDQMLRDAAAHPTIDPDVVWVRLQWASGSEAAYQDQIMYIPGTYNPRYHLSPETSSLALLLPGLLPVVLLLRRRRV